MNKEELKPKFIEGQLVYHRANERKALIIRVMTNTEYIEYEISTGFYFDISKIKYCTVYEIELEACND